MTHDSDSSARLTEELHVLRQRVHDLEQSEARCVELEQANAALRLRIDESEMVVQERDRLAAILEATTDFVGIADPHGLILYLNRAAREMIGIGLEESVGGVSLTSSHPSEIGRFILEEALPHAARYGSWSDDNVLLSRAGRQIPVSQVILAHQNKMGEVAYYSTIARDVSIRKKNEAIIHASESKYRHLVEASHVLIWSMDVEGRWTFVNRKATVAIFGYEPAEMLGRPFTDFQPPERAAKDLDIFSRVKSGEPMFRYESELLGKDGTPVFLSLDAFTLRDEVGNVLGATGTATDITELKRAEERLREERNYFQAMIDSLPGICFLVDTTGKLLRWNRKFERLSGYSPEEITASTPFDYVPAEEQEVVALKLADVFARGEASAELHFVDKQGQNPLYYFSGMRIFISGQPHCIGIGFDISERKRVENALRRSQASLELAQSIAKLGSWDFNLKSQSGNWSKEMFQHYHREIALGPPTIAEFLESIHPEDRDVVERTQARAFETDQTVNQDYRTNPTFGPLRHLTASLRRIDDHHGEPSLLVGTVLDITERKQAEQIVVEERNYFQSLIDGLPGICYLFDQSGKFLRWNRNFEKVSGYSPEEIAANVPTDYFIESVRGFVTERITEVFLDGESSLQADFVAKNGLKTPYSLTGARILLRDKPCCIGIGIDITERKRAEERLVASLEEKEVLLKEIHHRVKNNLQIVISLLSLQASTLQDPDLQAVFIESENRVRSMALIHENLYQAKDMSRIDLAEHADTLCRQIFRSFGADPNRITLETHIDHVALDLDRAVPFGLLLNELITNALKHAFPSGSPGKVSVELQMDAAGVYTLKVSDTGVGIPPDLERQSKKTLGLQLVDTLIKQLGGALLRTSDGGTKFEVTFPS